MAWCDAAESEDSRNVVLMAPTTNNGWDSSYSIEFAAVAEADPGPEFVLDILRAVGPEVWGCSR